MTTTRDELRAEADEASRAADEHWARFLSGFTHELKTPLASLSMITELLSREQGPGPSTDKEKRYTENLRELTREMQALVQDVGTLARLTGGRTQTRLQRIAPAELARRATETARGHGWERGVSLSTILDPDLPSSIRTDPGLLEDAVAGLLETAVVLADKEVVLRVGHSGEWLVATIEPDRGCAPGEDPEGLFDPFGGNTSRTLKQRGARSLAPLLARQIARTLGGDAELVVEGNRAKCILRVPLNL